jgi:putative membrane protein
MLVRFSRAALSLVLVLGAAPALAASPDAQFAMQAAQGGMAEVQLARLALTKSRNATVQAFARRMIADHTPNNAQLASIMRSEGLTVSTTVDPNSQKMMARLQGLSGRAFNRAYMTGQVRAHQQMQILMQSETNGGKDARLKAFARTTLGAVNMHLSMAKTDVAKLGTGGAMPGGSMSGGMSGGMSSGGSTSGGTPSSGMPASGMPSSGATPGSMTSPMPSSSMSPSGAMSSPMPSSSMSPSGSMGSPMPMASASPRPRPR